MYKYNSLAVNLQNHNNKNNKIKTGSSGSVVNNK